VGPRGSLDTEARGKILCLCPGSNPGRPVTVLTELPQLLFKAKHLLYDHKLQDSVVTHFAQLRVSYDCKNKQKTFP
jgi:hypothetical protein